MPDLLLGLFIGHRLSRWSSSGQDKAIYGSELAGRTRWSSSGQDKAIYGSELAGRLDFNQPTEGTTRFDALLEVQRPVR